MPPSNPAGSSSSQTYRNPTVEEDDDDDDDLDDLDDVLASFNAPKQPAAPASVSMPSSSGPFSAPPAGASVSAAELNPGGGDEEDFEASLMEGMESLLRQLAGDHPPGPMAGPGPGPSSAPQQSSSISGPGQAATTASTGDGSGQSGDGMSGEAEEEAWKKAVEMVLSGEGLAALGLDEEGSNQGQSKGKGKSRSTATATNGNAPASPSTPGGNDGATGAGGSKSSYEETLKRTLDSLNTAGTKPASNPRSGSGSGAGGQPDLASLLASLGGDPDLLKNLDLAGLGGEGGDGDGEGDDDGDLADVLEGMMSQLMTKEVLEEPMTELASKYPPYLASPPSGTSTADIEKYKAQYVLVQRILSVFAKSDYSDEKDGKEIAGLVSEMQDLGGPPKEVMGDMPDGFDLGAMGGGDEACTIM
ncbi:hypothetical protein IAT40_003915 [Kwoniella sp. CBS 6097]